MRDMNMNDMTTTNFLSRKRQVILDEIEVQKEMLSFWGHIPQTKKNIELKLSELEKSLEELTKLYLDN